MCSKFASQSAMAFVHIMWSTANPSITTVRSQPQLVFEGWLLFKARFVLLYPQYSELVVKCNYVFANHTVCKHFDTLDSLFLKLHKALILSGFPFSYEAYLKHEVASHHLLQAAASVISISIRYDAFELSMASAVINCCIM